MELAKRRTAAMIALLLLLALPSGQAYAEPLEVTDHPAPTISGAVDISLAQHLAVDEAESTAESAPEAAYGADYAESEYLEPESAYMPSEALVSTSDAITPDGGAWEAAYNPMYGENGPTHEMPGYHDGRKETYYSSNVLHHYRTGEWTVDEEGFYRTDEGYYVVGVSYGDYELGDTFEGGKGTCYVADYGWTDEPITDYYTNW